jgi:hypothetical protein
MDTLRRFDCWLGREYPVTRRTGRLAAAFLALTVVVLAYAVARRWYAGAPLWTPRLTRLIPHALALPAGLVGIGLAADWIERHSRVWWVHMAGGAALGAMVGLLAWRTGLSSEGAPPTGDPDLAA